MKNKVVAIIQARTASTRLPKKVLSEILGKPMIWHIIERVKKSKTVDSVVLATTLREDDDALEALAKECKIICFRGSEDDVLHRFYKAAEREKADIAVRITGDQALMDPDVIDGVVKTFKSGKYDLVGCADTFPDGLDVDVVSMKALKEACQEATLKSDREHVMPFIWKNPKRYKIGEYKNSLGNMHKQRWCVDEPEDYEFVKKVYAELYKVGGIFKTKEVVELLRKKRWMKRINSGIKRNEGYMKSLFEDKNLTKSYNLWQRAQRSIIGGSQTLSKMPNYFVFGASPIFLQKGDGCNVWDVDGNKYIDYVCALGPITLGYNYPRITKAVAEQIAEGTTFTMPHPLEIELAELLKEIIPGAESVRFAKNGSDVCSAAARIARAYTGREKIVVAGYNGWGDTFAVAYPRNAGIPKILKNYILEYKYNDINSLQKLFHKHPDDIAAVFLEIPGFEPKDEFIKKAIKLAHKNGALFVIDEVVTGGRYALGGAQEKYGFTADLCCMGKGFANGFSFAAVTGRKDVMDVLLTEGFFSGTFFGELTGIRAAIETIKEFKEKNVPAHIWKMGTLFEEEFKKLITKHSLENNVFLIGNAPRHAFGFKDWRGEDSQQLKGLFIQEMNKRGIILTSPMFISYAHKEEHIKETLEACDSALVLIRKAINDKNAEKYLEGKAPENLFTRSGGR